MRLKHRLAALAVWLAAMLVFAWLVATQVTVSTDLDAFMPAGGDAAELLSELREGPAQRLILMGITGSTEQARAAISAELAARLSKTGLFTRVANGENLLDVDGQRLLFAHRYLLSPRIGAGAADAYSPASLREALKARLQELRSPVPVTDSSSLTADPTREFYAVLQGLSGGEQPDTRRGVWFSRDGARALLLVETKAAGLDMDAQGKSVMAIENAFAKVAGEYQGARLALSGAPVLATASQDTIRSTVTRLSTAASAATALILLLAYRSGLVLLLAFAPLASAILVAVVTAGLLFGVVFGITLAFGMTLLGVAMDYPVHVFSHRRRDEAVDGTLRRVWPILRLGVVSTALGYTAMVTADLPGLRQLGVFAIAGLLTAAAVTRWVLPALLPAGWTPTHAGAGAWMDRILKPRPWLALSLSMTCVAVLIVTVRSGPVLWEDELASLSPISAAALAVDKELRSGLGAPEPGHLAIITAPDAQTALVRSERLAVRLRRMAARGWLQGFDMATRYLPSARTQRARQAALPPPDKLRADLERSQAGLPFKPGAFESFLRDVERARTAAPLGLKDIAGTALGARVESLLFARGNEWVALAPLSRVNNGKAVAARFAERPAWVKYVDLNAATGNLMAHFRDTGLNRFAWGAVLIVALLAAGLRDSRMVLASVAPVALAVVVTVCALLALERDGLTLFHIVSLLLVVGICIDYSLFFSHAGVEARRHTLHAVLVCGASTLVVFAMLAMSSIPVLRAIGLTVAIGVSASFLLALVLAPQLTRPRT
ncbi:MAG: MMPL family transporter [Gammaproteobacteria bacterium]|nr:MMPL family transporter [Gammaproteobacteria bacterium]